MSAANRRASPWRTTVFAFLLVILIVAGGSFHWWSKPLWQFAGVHSSNLQGLESLAQLVIWAGAVAVFLFGLLPYFRRREPDVAPPASTAQAFGTGGDAIAATGDVQTRGSRLQVDGEISGGVVVGRDLIVEQATPPIATSLHQLPAPPADFCGREKELDELKARVAGKGATISGLAGVAGMGGVGKTALALKAASELRDRYPDAQFYLDLKGTSPNPLTTADAMAHVIRAYHPDARLPESESALSGLYRSVLDGKRALLLMDNAANREQVQPLLPPEGCALLVTSRQHFVLPGLDHIDLDTLPPDDARELLLKIAPRIGGQADAIAQFCGYLPIALWLAARALAERPDLDPAEYAQRLSDAKQRLKVVDTSLELTASLTLSYDLLEAETQTLWRSLAVFPGTFDGLAAAAVWDRHPEQAQETLGRLLNYSMVEYDEATKRYRLHDLVRLFADSKLADDERSLAEQRHAAHYMIVLAAADELYLSGGEDVRRGLDLFDLESLNIHTGQRWAAERARTSKAARVLSNNYPNAGVYVLSLRLHARELIGWRDSALAAARALKHRQAECSHLGSLGVAHAALGEARRAIEYHEQSLAIAREVGDRRAEGNILGNLGNAHADLGETRRAIELHEQALTTSRDIGDRRGEGQDLDNLGTAYFVLGETRRAIEFSEQTLAIARKTGDRRAEAQDLGNLGNAYLLLGETRRGIEFHEQSLAIARGVGDRVGQGTALWNTSIALHALGQRDEAISHAEAALVIFQEIEDPNADTVRKTLAEWRGQG
jgi:tetratricopeptide (TPR) repeat protein